METQVKHEPIVKRLIKDAICKTLYGPIEERIAEKGLSIASRNAALQGGTHLSFMYKGVLHNYDKTLPPRKVLRLHINLHGEMDELNKQMDELNTSEIPYVVGFINQVLNSTNHLQDYLRMLPEVVHAPVLNVINQCPCKGHSLTSEQIQTLLSKNEKSLAMIKQRVLTNLIS